MHRSSHPDDLPSAIPYINKNVNQLAGIGEVGLDFTPRYIKDSCNKEEQRNVLRQQVNIFEIVLECQCTVKDLCMKKLAVST